MNKALEQFVKPEQLDGENSYKCSKYAGVAAGRLAVGLGEPCSHLCRLGGRWVSVLPGPERSESACTSCPREVPCPMTGRVCGGAVHGSCSALRGPADASVVSSVFVDSLLEAPVEWGSPSLRAVKALALSAASHPGFRVVTAGNIQC